MQLWFYAIFLFTTSRHGVSTKELQRQLDVTYKTAWRMAWLRSFVKHMAAIDGEAPLGGEGKVVEVDETDIGGKSDKGNNWREDKTVFMGMIERDGDLVAKVVDNATRASLMPQIHENIIEGTEIHTDELRSYKGARMAPYTHKTVNHSKDEYATPDGTSTNSIENFFGHLKRSIAGTHISVSPSTLSALIRSREVQSGKG